MSQIYAQTLAEPVVDLAESMERGRTAELSVPTRVWQPSEHVEKPAVEAKLAAKRPDASPRRVETSIRVAVHVLLLACIVVFIAYYCVYMPFRGSIAGAYKSAYVTSVASSLIEVRAPAAPELNDSTFEAVTSRVNGTPVRKDDCLGVIKSPTLTALIKQKQLELQMLQLQRFHADRDNIENPELSVRIADVEHALERLNAIKSQLVVRAPCDGLVHIGLASSMAIKPSMKIVDLYPVGSKMQVEVNAPLSVINTLEGKNQVVVEFATANGKVKVTAKPVQGSSRSYTKENTEKRTEIWAALTLDPIAMPDSVHVPGLIGRLQ